MFNLKSISNPLLIVLMILTFFGQASAELPKVRLTNVHHFKFSELKLVRANTKSPKGTILLLPEGSYFLNWIY